MIICSDVLAFQVFSSDWGGAVFCPHVLLLIAAAVSAIAAPAAAADQEKPKCFCLRHKATGSIVRFGCESFTVRHKFTPETRCLNDKLTAKATIEDGDAFEVVTEGRNGCQPCVPEAAGTPPDTIRGNGKEQSK